MVPVESHATLYPADAHAVGQEADDAPTNSKVADPPAAGAGLAANDRAAGGSEGSGL